MEIYRCLKETIPKEIVEFLDHVFMIYEIRGQVGVQNGIKFIVHTMEQNHVVPHVHAEYGEYHISIALDDQRALAGNLPKKQQKLAQQWVKEHRDELVSKWAQIAVSAIAPMTMSGLDTDWF